MRPWRTAVLQTLLEHSIGGVWGGPPGSAACDVRVLRVTELAGFGQLRPETAAHRSVTQAQLTSRRLRQDDLLLEKSGGGPNTPVGRVGLVPRLLEDSVCSNFMQLMRPRADVIDPRFLHLYLNHLHAAGATVPLQTASTNIRNIKMVDYGRLRVPLPEVEDQRRIVAILAEHLSDLDAAVACLKSAESRVARLRAAELERLFGSSGRASVPLGEVIADITAGKSFGAADRPALPDNWGIIKVSAMTSGEFRPNENKSVHADRIDPRFEIHPGDLLVSRANTSDHVGASVLVPSDVRPRLLLSDKSLRVTPVSNFNSEWLWRALQAPSARRQMSSLATGTKESMRNISQNALKRVLIPMAAGADQDRCVAGFRNVESVLARQRQLISELTSRSLSLRRAVLAAAFSGRLTGHDLDGDVITQLAEEESA